VKQSALRREPQPDPKVVDLTAYEGEKDDEADALAAERVREFYRANAQEVIARMRKPSRPTNNIAARIVLQCESDPRLRAEATDALEAAAKAAAARSPLDIAIEFYVSPTRS